MYLSRSTLDTCWERVGVLALFVCDVFLCFCHFPICCPESGVVYDCIVPDLWLILSLSYEKLFERKNKLVRDGLMFEKGHLLTTKG